MSHPIRIKEQVRRKRRKGLSIIRLANDFSLSKSTVSLWVRDIRLSSALRRQLAISSDKGCAYGRSVMAARRAIEKLEDRKAAMETLRRAMRPKNGHFWKLCAAIMFWCEGGKRQLSYLTFANSDPAMAAAFLHALREGFGVDESKFRVQLHLHRYHDSARQSAFWSEVTGIPQVQFHEPYMKQNGDVRKRDGYQGCASIRYGSARLARKLDALYHAFAKVIGA